MAAQHARAVQLNRHEYGDEINQQLAMKIALHMGSDNSPATLKVSTLAEAAPCHYNTADKRLKQMADDGLIKMSKNGKLYDYSIAGEWEDEIRQRQQPPTVDHSDEIEQINGRLDSLESDVKMLVKMVDNLHTIFTPSSHELHMNFTPPVNEDVNKEEKKVSREDIYIPPNPPSQERIDMAEIPSEALPKQGERKQLTAYIEAIGTQVRDYWGAAKNRQKFEDAAYMVIGYEEPIEKINGFDDYWQEYGWYENKGKASIDHFIDHWNDYVNGVNLKKPKPSKNGHPKPVPSQQLKPISPGRY